VNINRGSATAAASTAAAAGTSASGGGGGAAAKRGGRRDEHGRLVFVQESRKRFEIEDLLRASAEVLGSGNFGSSYKATLQERPAVVVKRFKDMNGVGREDFSEHMRRLGRLSHPNLLPVVAYLYKKDEKLLITDYITNGSLAHFLHGNQPFIPQSRNTISSYRQRSIPRNIIDKCKLHKILLPPFQVTRRFDFGQNQTILSLTKFIDKYSNIYNTKLVLSNQ
jgi:hypothetical protein